jgi:hypothetical protein
VDPIAGHGRVHCGVEPALKYRWHRTVIVGWAPALNPLSHRWARARALWGGTCSKISLASYCHCGVGSCSKSLSQFNYRSIQLHNKTNYRTKSITQQNQLHNKINYRMHKLKTNPTANQFNAYPESIQYQLNINSMLLPSLPTQCNPTQSITSNSTQSNLHQFNE